MERLIATSSGTTYQQTTPTAAAMYLDTNGTSTLPFTHLTYLEHCTSDGHVGNQELGKLRFGQPVY